MNISLVFVNTFRDSYEFVLLLGLVVNLTSILYLGALAINSISGINTTLCMYVLAIFAIFITLGGMKVIGYTDVIQVFFLILGGLVTTYLALSLVSDKFGGTGVVDGFNMMTKKANDHFHMIPARFIFFRKYITFNEVMHPS